MRLLLDTHIFLWWNSGDHRMPVRARAAIESPETEVYLSAVSVWEIAIKRAIGKLVFLESIVQTIEGHNFRPLIIMPEHAEWAGALPLLHTDPFDRMLIAQAQLEGLRLVTVDPLILRYQVPRL